MHSESFEETLPKYAFRRLARRSVSFSGTNERIDVVKRGVHAFLGQPVERFPLGEHVTHEFVVPLAFGFVVGAIGSRVEGAAFGCAGGFRVAFDFVERREFGPVVAEAGLERVGESGGYEPRHHGDDRPFGRRRISFCYQPACLQVEPGERYRQYRRSVVPFADDGIVLGDHRPLVGRCVGKEIAIRSSDEGADVADDDSLCFLRFRELPFEPNVSSKLVRLHGEGAGIDEPAKRSFAADFARPSVRDEDVVDRSSVLYLLRKGIQFSEAFARNSSARSRFASLFPRFSIRVLVVVKPLFEPAIGPFAAEIAYAEAPDLRALAGAAVPDSGAPLDFPINGRDGKPNSFSN